MSKGVGDHTGIAMQPRPAKKITSLRWSVDDPLALARLIALILLGQAEHAAEIIRELSTKLPLTHAQLVNNALDSIALDNSSPTKLAASRWRRDGLLFECISWIASHLEAREGVQLATAPHLKSTTQGLDGLLIDWLPTEGRVVSATIVEDKCSERPRAMFRDDVLPTFKSHHRGDRDTELLATAVTLIRQVGLTGSTAIAAAAAVLEKPTRAYRAGLAVTPSHDSDDARARLFKGYPQLKDLRASARIGATLVIDEPDLRGWFDRLAGLVSDAIEQIRAETPNV